MKPFSKWPLGSLQDLLLMTKPMDAGAPARVAICANSLSPFSRAALTAQSRFRATALLPLLVEMRVRQSCTLKVLERHFKFPGGATFGPWVSSLTRGLIQFFFVCSGFIQVWLKGGTRKLKAV